MATYGLTWRLSRRGLLYSTRRHQEGPERSIRHAAAGDAPSPVWVGGVSIPLTLALSRREREHRTPRCDEPRRPGLAKARRTILPPPRSSRGEDGELDAAPGTFVIGLACRPRNLEGGSWRKRILERS